MSKATETHYLPMCCRICGRNRLQYDPVANTIECEKCNTRWPDYDDDGVIGSAGPCVNCDGTGREMTLLPPGDQPCEVCKPRPTQ